MDNLLKVCRVNNEDCTNTRFHPHTELCAYHYNRHKRGEDIYKRRTRVKAFSITTCKINNADCNKDGKHRAKGFCCFHYKRFLNNIPLLKPKKSTRSKIGAKHLREGYFWIKIQHTGNPWADWQAEHRFVMEQHLKRPLRPKEHVHHVNGDIANNTLENLELWINSHPAGQRVPDRIAYAIKILDQYAPHYLSNLAPTTSDTPTATASSTKPAGA